MTRRLSIGSTVRGAAIEAVFIPAASSERSESAALLFAAIHGDEPAGVTCIDELEAELLCERPGRPTWLIRALNLDGLAAGERANARGVDLNRNFAASNWTKEHAEGYFPGASPESEPESQAISKLIDDHDITRIIAIHEPFAVVNWDGKAQPLAADMAARCGYPVASDIGYPTPGSFGSKYGIDRGLEVITLELPDTDGKTAWSQVRSALRYSVGLGD